MKTPYIFSLIGLLLFGGNSLNAQNDANSKKGGIYLLYVHMSDDLTTEYKKTNNSRTFLNGYSESAIFPDNLLDSVKVRAEMFCSEKLQADVTCIYKMSKKGKQVTSIGANGEIEGMPANTFKNAVANSDLDYYVRLSIMMHPGGKAIMLNNGKESIIRPVVDGYIKVFDEAKNVVWKNSATLKDFSTLRSTSSTDGDITVTVSETLGPEDIFMIYERTLIELFKEE